MNNNLNTREDALKKQCPIEGISGGSKKCLVDSCMMWVWVTGDGGICGLITYPGTPQPEWAK